MREVGLCSVESSWWTTVLTLKQCFPIGRSSMIYTVSHFGMWWLGIHFSFPSSSSCTLCWRWQQLTAALCSPNWTWTISFNIKAAFDLTWLIFLLRCLLPLISSPFCTCSWSPCRTFQAIASKNSQSKAVKASNFTARPLDIFFKIAFGAEFDI